MSKATTKTLVPKLRFPEFRNARKWDKIKLIDVADKKIKWSFIGGPFGSNLKSSDYVTEGIRIIQLQNIGDGEFKGDYKIFTSEEKANELLSNNIYPEEIILSKMGDPVGRACLIPNTHTRYVMCSDGIRLVVDEELFSKYFIYTLINSVQFRALVERTATGSTRKRIGLDDLKKLPMIVPKRNEQQKIADCLSSIDELITAHSQKHEALKVHKKGLMQQLFPAQDDDCMDTGGRATQDAKAGTVPKLRFPEFQDAGEWAEQLLGDIATVRSGSTPLRSNSDFYEGGNIPWVKTTDLNNSFIFCTEECITSQAKAKINPEGSVLVAMYGGFNQIGRTGYLKVPAATNQALSVLNSDRKIIIPIYLLMWLNAKVEIWKSIASSSRKDPNIKGSDVASFPIIYPKINEQQKIADCLSSIDDLITAQSQKIESLKAHKKGLMQQLFPVADEVNG